MKPARYLISSPLESLKWNKLWDKCFDSPEGDVFNCVDENIWDSINESVWDSVELNIRNSVNIKLKP